VDTLLTLVIALGGIATGIGAIWTAMLARRQLGEQRRFLEEQNEISRSQARLTERSLAQTERSLVEQNERAREENDRARRSYEVDMMLKLDDRWESPVFLDIKRKAANHVKAHFLAADGTLLEVQHMDVNAERLLGIFELLGDLVEQGEVRAETVWHRFGFRVRQYWALYRPAIEKIRQESKDPTLFDDFERLEALMADLDHHHGVGDEYIKNQQLRRTVEGEAKALATEEAPTQEEEEVVDE
jgi:hypothetical protein